MNPNETFFNQCFRCAVRFESKVHPAITCEKCLEINAKERAVIEGARALNRAEFDSPPVTESKKVLELKGMVRELEKAEAA